MTTATRHPHPLLVGAVLLLAELAAGAALLVASALPAPAATPGDMFETAMYVITADASCDAGTVSADQYQLAVTYLIGRGLDGSPEKIAGVVDAAEYAGRTIRAQGKLAEFCATVRRHYGD